MPDMDTSLKELMQVDGAVAAAVVDYGSGMAFATVGGTKDLDLTTAAAGNTEVIRAKMRVLEMLGIKEPIEDILITLTKSYHLIRPLTARNGKGLFLYLVLNSAKANLAMARRQLMIVDSNLEL